ncbi:MAG: hypothetical protein ACRDHW_00350 [Ktedonobacteraceae bacterium]
MNLRFLKGELTPEQESFIQRTGETTGIPVLRNPAGDFWICHLTTTQFARLAWATSEQWGIPFNSVIVQEEQ